jgi:UDP-glucose 4-epimerase
MGSMRLVDWPADAKRIDIGSFYSDSSRFSTVTGWAPTVNLEAGLGKTMAYYREHLSQYVGTAR